jgi:hypothetical protein
MNLRPMFGFTALVACLSMLVSTGCAEAERTYDCAKICNKYAECIDDGIDKADCTDRCEDHGQDDDDFEEQASECEDCVSGESCTDATVECSAACAWVVAEST